jgi:hypothetical protein
MRAEHRLLHRASVLGKRWTVSENKTLQYLDEPFLGPGEVTSQEGGKSDGE